MFISLNLILIFNFFNNSSNFISILFFLVILLYNISIIQFTYSLVRFFPLTNNIQNISFLFFYIFIKIIKYYYIFVYITIIEFSIASLTICFISSFDISSGNNCKTLSEIVKYHIQPLSYQYITINHPPGYKYIYYLKFKNIKLFI